MAASRRELKTRMTILERVEIDEYSRLFETQIVLGALDSLWQI